MQEERENIGYMQAKRENSSIKMKNKNALQGWNKSQLCVSVIFLIIISADIAYVEDDHGTAA